MPPTQGNSAAAPVGRAGTAGLDVVDEVTVIFRQSLARGVAQVDRNCYGPGHIVAPALFSQQLWARVPQVSVRTYKNTTAGLLGALVPSSSLGGAARGRISRSAGGRPSRWTTRGPGLAPAFRGG